MIIRKIALGNKSESFIESSLKSGINIISSDDNHKGKTIVIQSLMFALGNDPTFPASFEYKDYYYYVEFEVVGNIYIICRNNDSFILKTSSALMFFDSVSELKRYWTKNIFPLPTIIKNQILRIVDPVLFFQLFFVGQDEKDTSNIAHAGYYNKNDFINMLFSLCDLGSLELNQDEIILLRESINTLKDERALLTKQYKILKSQKKPVSYLSTSSDRESFTKKVSDMEKINSRIAELRKARNVAATRKAKWETTIKELRSLNRSIDSGELRCMDCNSNNISFCISKKSTYAFDVSTIEMRDDIISSINEKIAAYDEEIQKYAAQISKEQELLQEIMADESITLESIVAYKQEIFSAADAEVRIKEIDINIAEKESKLIQNEESSQDTKARRSVLLEDILNLMNDFCMNIEKNSKLHFESLFTKRDETYSGSEATVFYLVKLLALRSILGHNFPIVIDSFRAEDLSTSKESTALELFKRISNQIIFTTTLKNEELGKYNHIQGINHIDYSSHTPFKILSPDYNEDFVMLLSPLSIKLEDSATLLMY